MVKVIHRSEGKQLDPHEEDQHSKSTEASSTDDLDSDKDEDISNENLKGLPFNSFYSYLVWYQRGTSVQMILSVWHQERIRNP